MIDKKPKTPICAKIIKTIDNNKLPCLRPQNHKGGCNPFSDNPAQEGQKKNDRTKS